MDSYVVSFAFAPGYVLVSVGSVLIGASVGLVVGILILIAFSNNSWRGR